MLRIHDHRYIVKCFLFFKAVCGHLESWALRKARPAFPKPLLRNDLKSQTSVLSNEIPHRNCTRVVLMGRKRTAALK